MLERDVRCRECDYPLKGLPSGTCPECGYPFDWNKRSTYKLGDEVGQLHGMWINRKRAALRLAIVFSPGMLVFLLAWTGRLDLGFWGCFLILTYPFWVLACTVCVLSLVSPMGLLSTPGAMLLGIGIALPFALFFGLGFWGLALAIPAGLVSGLVFKHMELNDML